MYRFLLLMSLICLLVAGCSANVETEIIGEWRGITPKQDLVFYENGQVEMKSPNHSTYTGSYSIKDGNKLTCIFPALSRPVECTAKIRGDRMTLLFASGREENYVKQ